MKIACLNDYQRVAISLADWSSLGAGVEVHSFDRAFVSTDDAADNLAPFDVLCLMRERLQIDRALIDRLPALRLITVTGSRFRCVDLQAAGERGIVVCAAGGGEPASTVEHALALILAAAKRIPQEDRNLRAGGWQQGMGMLLEGRTLGVIGLGKIGTRIASLCRALGMSVIAWSPNLTPERAAAAGAECVSKERLFAEADIVSIHMVLSDATHGLVGASDLALMKSTAILVNTSRGPIVDELALVDALQRKRIACAALDVFDQEPLPAGHPLATLPNTVLTPHMGFVSDRGYDSYYRKTVETIRAWRDGHPTGVQTFGGATAA